mgnify:CR=1 FL=1
MKSGRVGSRIRFQLSSVMLVWLWTIFGGLWTVEVDAQQSLQAKYPFLQTDKNKIDFYGDSTKFNQFFERLDRVLLAGDGQVNVLHMGGSHVQGGVLTHTMRQQLQSLAPGLKGQRGLVFPYTLAKTNNPYNYVVRKTGDWEEGERVSVSHHDSQWGISGITAKTTDARATTTIYARHAEDAFAYERVRVFYYMSPGSFQPIVNGKGIITTVYDSTRQFMEVSFDSPQDTLQLSFMKMNEGQTGFILQGLQFLSGGPAIVYNPIGVNGAKVRDYFRSQALPEQLKLISPDLVIFGIGINDANVPSGSFDQAKYEEYYDKLVTLVKEINPQVSILFLVNNDSHYDRHYANPNVYKVRDAMIKLAKLHNGAVWDFFEIMGGFDSIRTWEAYDLARADRIHFSREGYELQGQLLFYALRNAYGDYLSARFK